MSEPARAEPPRPQLEVRVGSATNALRAVQADHLNQGHYGLERPRVLRTRLRCRH